MDERCKGDKQVINVGAGVDTRPYWLSCLSHATYYWAIDTVSVIKYKHTILDGLEKKGQLPCLMCPIRTVSMDVGKESIVNVLSEAYKFDTSIPSCWILEGLIMYLKRADVEQLMDSISQLSQTSSYLILNFSTNMPATSSPSIDELDELLSVANWKKVDRLMFGEEGFHYDRYPKNKPANKIVGFAMYEKE